MHRAPGMPGAWLVSRLCALMIALLLPHGAAARESVLWALRLGDQLLTDGIEGTNGPAGPCVDLNAFTAAIGFSVHHDPAKQRIAGWYVDESRSFSLDVASGNGYNSGQTFSVDPAILPPIGESLCVPLATLSRWFPVDLKLDRGNATILVEPRETLPIQARIERDSRHAQMSGRKGTDIKPVQRVLLPMALASWPTIDLQADAGYDGSAAPAFSRRYALTLGQELLYLTSETLLQSDDRGRPATLRWRGYRRDPDGKLPGSLTELGLGDINAPGNELVAGGASGRGLLLSSQPLDIPDQADRTSFQGDLPAGWQAELYRNGALIDFASDSADNRYQFRDVPVLFGQNQFKVVLYGPQGERRETEKTITAGFGARPRHGFDWRLALIEDGANLVRLQASPAVAPPGLRLDAETRFGLGRGSTAQIGLSSISDNGLRHWYPQAAVQASLASMLVSLQSAFSSEGGAALQLAAGRRIGQLGLNLRALHRTGDFNSERVPRSLSSRISLDSDLVLLSDKGWQMPLTLRALWEQDHDGRSRFALDQQTGFSWKRHSLSHALLLEQDGERWRASAALGANLRFKGWSLRSQLLYDLAPKATLTAVQATVDFAPNAPVASRGPSPWFVRSAVQWSFQNHRGEVAASLSRVFEHFRLGITGGVDSDGHVRTGLTVGFSLGRDAGRWSVAAAPQATQGRIAARVFEDVDGDGRFGSGDRLVPDVRVTANNQPGVAAGRGISVLRGLEGYEDARLAIDPGSLDNPDLSPRDATLLLRPRPGYGQLVDLPLVVTGEVDGLVMLTRDGRRAAIGGIEVELVDSDGTVRGSARSGYDGFYLFEKVRPGEYQLRISPDQLDKLGLRLVRQVPVRVDRKNPFPGNLTLNLEARPKTQP